MTFCIFQKIGGHRLSSGDSWVNGWRNMALKTKPRSLDAICAKLKKINNDSPTPIQNLHQEIDNRKESNNNVDICSSLPNGKCVDIDQPEETSSLSINYDATVETNGNVSNYVSSSSRRKRKLSVPRNINQVRDFVDKIDDIDEKDELAEYTLNNQNTTFPPENESDDIESLENESDLSCDKNNISNDSGVAVDLFNGNCVGEKSIDVVSAMVAASALRNNKQFTPAPSQSFVNNRKHSRKSSNPKSSLINVPLDLSVTKTVENVNDKHFDHKRKLDDNETETPEDLSLTAENLSTTAESFNNTAEDLSKTAEREQQNFENSVKKQSQDVTVLKDYAESTMNELLSMYGFSGNSDHLTKHVPLQSFTSKQILQTTMAQGKDIAKVLTAVSPQQNGLTNFSIAEQKGIYANFVSTAQKLKIQGEGL